MFVPDNEKTFRFSDIGSSTSFTQISNSLNSMRDSIDQYLNYIKQIERTYSELSKKQKACSEKMAAISELPDNWNENGAKKFSDKLIAKCYSLLFGLPIFPEIFPVADGSIQFEFEKSDGSYLEFDIFENEISEYRVYPDGKEIERTIDQNKISEEVKDFYEQSDK